jgi:hypothetical protein
MTQKFQNCLHSSNVNINSETMKHDSNIVLYTGRNYEQEVCPTCSKEKGLSRIFKWEETKTWRDWIFKNKFKANDVEIGISRQAGWNNGKQGMWTVRKQGEK